VIVADGELATLRQYLVDYRAAFEAKTAGLDAEQLARRSVPPSSLSLLGLVRHLAQLEQVWFEVVIGGHTDAPRHWDADTDWERQFDGAVADPAVVEEAFATWRAERARTDARLDALTEADLGTEVRWRDRTLTVRTVLFQVVDEYAHHCGHADLLREAVDGRTG
jgi:hypothetical protein